MGLTYTRQAHIVNPTNPLTPKGNAMNLAQYIQHLNTYKTSPTTHSKPWSINLAGVHELLGLPTDTDLAAWARTEGSQLYIEERVNLIQSMATQAVFSAVYGWMPRYVTFGHDPQDAYEEVADCYRSFTCHDCDVESIRHQAELQCPLCGEDADDTTPVDMDTDRAMDEVANLNGYQLEDYYLMLHEYCHATKEYTALNLEGSNLGWQHRSGTQTIRNIPDDLQDALSLSCDFTIQVSWDKLDNTLQVMRSHHDAPTGEDIKVTLTHLCELDSAYTVNGLNYAEHAATLIPHVQGIQYASWDGLLYAFDNEYNDTTLSGLLEAIGPDVSQKAAIHLAELIELMQGQDVL